MRRGSGIQAVIRVVALAALALSTGLASAQLKLLPLPGGVPGFPLSPLTIDPALSLAGAGEPIQAVLTFDHYPTAAELLTIQAAGVQVRPFRALPMVGVQGTGLQIRSLPTLPGLRSIYLNRRLTYFLDESVPLIGAPRVWSELGFTGKGVTVAVIDSGIDATHRDLPFGTKVVQNVKLAPDLFGTGPLVLEGLSNTDTTSGHGTHVAGIAGGSGAALGGKYRGVATGSQLVGIGAGEALFILTALEGFDWVLQNRLKYGIRVISNSWGTSGAFSPDDPVNVASKIAHDAGLVVVFAAGNEGPGANTLSPYCVAPWVICAAAGHKDGARLAEFSSRGVPADPLQRPTLTAPGVEIASARASTGIVINTFFAVDLIDLGADAPSYAAASGTSMATPHVSGTVALMLEANPTLTPDQVKAALEQSATPMPGYQRHEVGAGYLNAYEAVRTVQRP
jgi:serine protease AprX